MPGVHIPEAPGFSGWTKLRGGEWKTMNPSEVEQMRKALSEDMEACGCNPRAFAPAHATGYTTDHSAVTYRCRSFSRWYNPQTRKMEGNAHCTCDGCF